MNRCTGSRRSATRALLAGLFFFLLSSICGLAAAQGIRREAPRDVILGQLVVVQPPRITIDGKPDMLSPGSRVRDLNNMLVLSGSIVGQTLPVVYRRDAAGLVHEAWILTADEYVKLGGAYSGGSSDGYLRFNELLMLIFGARR